MVEEILKEKEKRWGREKLGCLDAWKSVDLKLVVCRKENCSFHLNLRDCLKE